MELTREKAVETLISVLYEWQLDMVDEPEEINESTNPITDLKNFDSLASVSITVHSFDALGFDIDDEPPFPSLFVKKNRALTVGEAANRIIKFNKSLMRKEKNER